MTRAGAWTAAAVLVCAWTGPASGQSLRIVIENAAGTLHNLSIPAAGIDRDVPPRPRITIDLIAPHTGVIEYFCKFHGSLGQQGRLVLVD